MTPVPPSGARFVWVLIRMSGRQFLNRLGFLLRGRRKKGSRDGSAPRTATPGKRSLRWIIYPLVALLFVPQGLLVSAQVLRRFVAAAREVAGPSDHVEVRPLTFARLKDLEAESLAPGGATRSEAQLREELRGLFKQELLLRGELGPRSWKGGQPGSPGVLEIPPEQAGEVDRLTERFLGSGSRAFRARWEALEIAAGFHALRETEEVQFLRLATTFLTLFLALLWISGLGTANQDLGRVEWSFEWLFWFPVSSGTLFAARVFEYSVVTVFPWFSICPFLIVLYWTADWGWYAVPLGLGVTASFCCMLGALRAAVETWLRKRCTLSRIKNIQALCTGVGLIGLYALLYLGVGRGGTPSWFLAAARGATALIDWTPVGLAVQLAASNHEFSFVLVLGVACAVSAGLAILAAVTLCVRVTADGLLRDGGGPYQGARGGERRRAAIEGGGRGRAPLGPMVRRELRRLLRDRNFFVQTLIVPAAVLGFQLALNPGMLRAGESNPSHGAMIAFGIGAYVLMTGAFTILTSEEGGLWLLYTFPRELSAVFRQKAVLWAAISFLYTSVALALLLLQKQGPGLPGLLPGAQALVGIVLYAYIATAFGMLAVDPLETSPQRRVNPAYIYLYMLTASLYGYGIYAADLWSRIVTVILTVLLAAALWQKVRERLPYLLDPTASPPPALLAADGLLAGFAFFALQGVLSILLALAMPGQPGPVLTIAFGAAGAVVAVFSLYLSWRARVPRVLEAFALRAPPGARWRLPAACGLGACAGAVAGLLGLLYLIGAQGIPVLRETFESHRVLADAQPAGFHVWIAVLAVGLAPLFEELIFRGMIFRGLRRTASPALAALGSAAIFAVVHPAYSALPVFGLGLAAAIVLEITGLLWAPVAAHMVYNAIVIFLQG